MNKPRLLSDNGSSYVAGELAECLGDKNKEHVSGHRIIRKHMEKIAVILDTEEPQPIGKSLLPGRLGSADPDIR